MPSNHLILCRPLLLLPSIFPSIRVFPNESALCIRWPKYWSFSFNTSPSSEHPGLIPFRMDWLDLLAVHSIGDQSWVFFGRTDAKAEAPILWPADVKSLLIGKALMLGMGLFVFIYKLFIPLGNVILTLIPVAVGAVLYFFLLFKIDRGIRDEIAGMVTTLGLPWPKWL